jgi:glutaminyl-tRNA synthetase
MPTICGLRRRGYTPASIRAFSEQIGVAKADSTVEFSFLEHCLRADLDNTAQRVMAVLRPVKCTIVNYPEGQSETFEIENHPKRPELGSRTVTFSRNLYIEAEDFMEEPVKKYKRLSPDGLECRLKGAYVIRCVGCNKDENGNVVEVLCQYDPDSRGGDPADGRKIKGAAIHWVDAATAVDAEIRLYDNLFSDPEPDAAGKNFLDCLNPNSLEVLQGCKVESALASAAFPTSYQFMRQGYFCVDNKDSAPGHLVFNRAVSLKDSFKA